MHTNFQLKNSQISTLCEDFMEIEIHIGIKPMERVFLATKSTSFFGNTLK